MGLSTTNQQLFIVEMSPPFSKVEIQFVPPSVKNPRSATLQDVVIVGRNDDLVQYVSGKESLTLNLDFLADNPGREDVYEKVNWLKSLTMNDGYSGKFRNVKIVWGKMFKNLVWVIKSVSPDFSDFDDQQGWLPIRAQVVVEFQLDPVKNTHIEDVRNL
jgi:hypothetical protein